MNNGVLSVRHRGSCGGCLCGASRYAEGQRKGKGLKKRGIWKTAAVTLTVILFFMALFFGYRFLKRDRMLSSAGSLSCSCTIRCDAILEHQDRLEPGKREMIPADGVIMAERTVSFDEGETVFDVLYRVIREEKIHMEFSDNALYGAVYIEGIANIYEFDCGELSGWMYSVNGEFPMYGMSQCEVWEGDRIEVVYTCDLGEDVGSVFHSEE